MLVPKMNSDNTDAEIIEALLGGDKEVFRLLIDKYSDAMFRFCRSRLGNDGDAEDAVQDVFIRAFRSISSFKLGKSFPSWLFAIAANRVKSRYQSRTRDEALSETIKREACTEISQNSEEEALDALDASRLREALGKLPKQTRVPLELFYFSGLSVSDASRVLGIGVEAFKSRLFRGRKQLSKSLEDSEQPRRLIGGI